MGSPKYTRGNFNGNNSNRNEREEDSFGTNETSNNNTN